MTTVTTDEIKIDDQGLDAFDSGFSLAKECSKLSHDNLSKFSKMKAMGYSDAKLNFLKLRIYKWNLNDTIKFYEKDKFCWNYFIDKKCQNQLKCKCTHDNGMTLSKLYKTKRHQYLVYCCEYLVSTSQYCNNAIVYDYYAWAQYRLDNLDTAERLAHKAIEIDANNDDAQYLYGAILDIRRKKFDQAKIHYQKAIDVNPNIDYYHGNMANILCNKMCQYNESLFYSKKAFTLDDKEGAYSYLIGQAYYNLKQ